MSQQAAFDYLTQAFADATQSTMVAAIGDGENWPVLVFMGTQKAFQFTPDEAKKAYETSNSWSWYASEATGFGFAWKDYFGTGKVLQQGMINAAGALMGRHEQAILGGVAAAAAAGTDIPGSVATLNGGWTVSLTDTGNFTFRNKGDAKLFIEPDGRVWSQGVGGYLSARGASPDQSGADLRILYPPPLGRQVYNGWTISVTQAGNYAIKRNGQTRLYINTEGDFWGAGAGGFFAAQRGSEGTYKPSPIDMATQGAALIVGGGFVLAGAGYNAAVDWVKGAGRSAYDWTTGAAHSAANWSQQAGQDAARWAKQAGLDATTWTANAAKDAAHWIANTASNAGRAIARVFNPSHW